MKDCLPLSHPWSGGVALWTGLIQALGDVPFQLLIVLDAPWHHLWCLCAPDKMKVYIKICVPDVVTFVSGNKWFTAVGYSFRHTSLLGGKREYSTHAWLLR